MFYFLDTRIKFTKLIFSRIENKKTLTTIILPHIYFMQAACKNVIYSSLENIFKMIEK